jgi:hypothetical protein
MTRPAACWGLCLLLCAAEAHAEDTRYWIDWSAPAQCPVAAQLHSEVQARSASLQLDPEGARVRVNVSQDASGQYLATARLPSGGSRDVKALHCSDVVSALAFIVVMDLDPELRQGSSTEDGVTEASTPAPERATEPPGEWHGYAGVTGGATGGLTPGLMPQGGLFYELWHEGAAFARGARASVNFGAGQLASGPRPVSLRFFSSSLDVCPVGIGFASLCAGLDLGATDVRSGAALSNRQSLRFSAAGRAGLALRQVFAERWLAEIGGGAWLPLTLYEFAVERANRQIEPVHRIGASAYISLSLGLRL